MSKLIVGCDLDATVSSAKCQIPLYNKISGKNLTYEDITDYMVEEIYGVPDMYQIIMRDYKEEYFDNVDIRPCASEVINKLIELDIIETHIITARSDTDYIRMRTNNYLYRHDLGHIPLHMLSSHNKLSKAIELGLDIMIDDRGETCLELAEAGITVLMMDTPYNRKDKFKHENIYRCRDFLDVFRIINELYYER